MKQLLKFGGTYFRGQGAITLETEVCDRSIVTDFHEILMQFVESMLVPGQSRKQRFKVPFNPCFQLSTTQLFWAFLCSPFKV